MKNIYAIGVGLIGGSLAIDIKKNNPDVVIHGISRKDSTLDKALELKLIDKKATLDDIENADLVIVSIPVDATVKLLPTILDKVSEKVQDVLVSDRKTVKAGNLAHLKAVVSGNLSSQFTALDLVNTLHPTPAVCGLPKESAIDFILKNEGYDRSYY